MGAYRGNADKVMADAKKIARRLRETNATFTGLQKEYHCSYPAMMRAVLSQMSQEEWEQIRRKKLAQGGVETRFQKGQASWNKGMHYNPGGRSVETRFQKGHLPANYKPLKTISIRNDNGKQFRWIKIKDSGLPQDRSVPYARRIWEKENGPIPPGHLIVHGDGNTLNDSPDNLVLVDRAGHLLHQMESNPSMLKKCRRNAGQAAKKRHILYRKQKAKTAKETIKIREQELKLQQRAKAKAVKEAAKIRKHEQVLQRKARRQAERDARAKAMVESCIVVARWECISCGFDFTGEPPWKCPKCEGLRFSKITQRKYAKVG